MYVTMYPIILDGSFWSPLLFQTWFIWFICRNYFRTQPYRKLRCSR